MLFETQKRGLKMLEIVIKREENYRMNWVSENLAIRDGKRLLFVSYHPAGR